MFVRPITILSCGHSNTSTDHGLWMPGPCSTAVSSMPACVLVFETPLLGQGGEDAPSIRCSEGTFYGRGRGGWFNNRLFLTNTTPSAPSTVASQLSIDGAASPPRLRRGIIASPKSSSSRAEEGCPAQTQ